ncbi:MAG TPA: hypothetical protein VFY83_16560 [Anaerolineales bacterium]|nr:hypothetical protein [Anaerolineales bacterium]
MNRAYTLYCRIAAVIFIVNTLYPVMVKLFQHRLAHDWFHSFLHLLSALFGAYAGWRANSISAAKAFTWSIGMLYMGLGMYGWFTPGLFLSSPLAIPLGIADNIFHPLLGVPAWTIIMIDAEHSCMR